MLQIIIDNFLLNWKKQTNRYPLIVKEERQIGKNVDFEICKKKLQKRNRDKIRFTKGI